MFAQKRSPVTMPLCLVCKPSLVEQNVGVRSAEEDELSLSISHIRLRIRSQNTPAHIAVIHQPLWFVAPV